MDLEAIKQYLQDNKDNADVMTFVQGLGTAAKVDITSVKDFISDNEEGKRWMQSQMDSKVTQGIDTWKTNHLQKTMDDEISKRFPDETPESKKLKQLESELADERNARKRETLKNKALGYASEKKLPTELIDHLLGEDEESTMSNMTKLETIFQARLAEAVESKFIESGRDQKKGGTATTFTREQIEAMSEADINKNWDAIQESMSNGSL